MMQLLSRFLTGNGLKWRFPLHCLKRSSIFANNDQIIVFFSQKSNISSNIYDQLTAKGLLCAHFPQSADLNQVLSKKQTIYAGFDATGPSLHVGNLLVLISLFHLLKYGHRIIALVGDSTARIGDPAGKSMERAVLDDDLVDSNAAGIEQDIVRVFNNFKRFFAKIGSVDDREFIICRNGTWYQNMNVIEFVNKYGRQLRMGDMLSKSSIRERLESPTGLNFAEFAYQTFQAYDWYYLYKRHQCKVQLGGIDQTVNIHNGYTLIKKLGHEYSYGLFIPLITDDRGHKIGKSEGKAIFLDPDRTTPFGLYQYFMRLPDKDVGRFFKLFSFRPVAEIETMIQNQMKNSKPWHLQKKLAEEMTMLVHGDQGLEKAQRITAALFDKNLELLGNLNEQEIHDVFDGLPIYHLEFEPNRTTVLDLAIKTEFFDSELPAIKTICEGGFYVNYHRETEPGRLVSIEEKHVLKNGITIVSLGKRKHRLVRWI